MKLAPTTLQALIPELGRTQAMRFCAPVAFYIFLQAAGYLEKDMTPGEFCRRLMGHESLLTHKFDQNDWSRPALTKYFRDTYKARIVSWQFGWPPPPNLAKMKAAGYFNSKEEERFFLKIVHGKSAEQLVRQGYPVMVTMKPGFGDTTGTSVHAVIIVDWQDDRVEVVDPDARNLQSTFPPDTVRASLSEDGAGTIVLPKTLFDILSK